MRLSQDPDTAKSSGENIIISPNQNNKGAASASPFCYAPTQARNCFPSPGEIGAPQGLNKVVGSFSVPGEIQAFPFLVLSNPDAVEELIGKKETNNRNHAADTNGDDY